MDEGDALWAVRTHDYALVRKLITPENVHTSCFLQQLMLHDLSYDEVAVAHALDCGADPNTGCFMNWMILHDVTKFGSVAIVEKFLTKGADVNCMTKLKTTPLTIALRRGAIDIAKCLVDYGAQLDLVHDDDIPEWIVLYASGRERARAVTIVLLGIRRKRYARVIGSIDIHVIRMIARLLWSTRGRNEWQPN